MASRSQPLLTNISTCRNAPKWSMRGRSAVRDMSTGKSPGPGSYGVSAPDKTRSTRAPSAQFGTALRDQTSEAQRQLPGPGQYTPAVNVGTTPKFGFGTSLRGGPAGGPGRGRSVAPGPGTYELRTEPSGKKVSMTSRHADSKSRSLTPGPGAYASNSLNDYGGPRFGFGTALRPDLSRSSKGPGPGTYMQTNSIGQQSVTRATQPKYSMKPRRTPAMQGTGQTPGPSLSYTQFG